MKSAAAKPAALLLLAALLGTFAACGPPPGRETPPPPAPPVQASPSPTAEEASTIQARVLAHTPQEWMLLQAQISSLDDITDEMIYEYPASCSTKDLWFSPIAYGSDFTVGSLDGILYFLGVTANAQTDWTLRYTAELDGVKLAFVRPDGTVEYLDSAAPDTELTLCVPAGESALAVAGYQGCASIKIQPDPQDGITLDTALVTTLLETMAAPDKN